MSYIVRDYNTTELLSGGIDADLIAASYAEGNAEGAVLAESDEYGVWQFVPEAKRTDCSRVVYIERLYL